VTRRGGVTMSAGGETTPGRKREETMPDANLTGIKINKIHAFDSVDRNER
jgi:hypothetical protein